MQKEKIESLAEYLRVLKTRLLSPVPTKHTSRANEYRNFLVREIRLTERSIAELGI